MKFIHGDLFEHATEGLIIHQVNSFFVMGAGFAAQLKKTYPLVEEAYLSLKETHSPEDVFGMVQVVKVNENLEVANMFSQYRFGRKGQFTSYEQFARCLQKIDNRFHKDVKISIPHGIGSALGGADWFVILSIIKGILGHRGDNVTIYSLQGGDMLYEEAKSW